MTNQKAETGLAGRYANAVFELAREQKAIDAVSADLAALNRAMDTSLDLARLVKSPVFAAAEQAQALKPVLAAMRVSPLTTNFLLLLTSKRRLFALQDVIAAFERLVAASRGETQAEVTSARALNDNEITELKAVLKAKLGKEPRLNTRIDPALLGGLVVKVGSRMIDTSLRTKLDGLRAVMKGQ